MRTSPKIKKKNIERYSLIGQILDLLFKYQ
jgi:hypothetical protein